MTRSEKLLDAIGQIDDKLIEEAAAAGGKHAEASGAGKKAAGKGKKAVRRAAVFRWQSALAACAVLAVCTGVFLLLQNKGLLLAPESEDSMEAAQDAVPTEKAAGAEVEMEEAAPEEAAVDSAAPEKAAAENGGTGNAGGQSAEKTQKKDGQCVELPDREAAATAGADAEAAAEDSEGAAPGGAAAGDLKGAESAGGESQIIGCPAMQESIRDAEKESEARNAEEEAAGRGSAAGESAETQQRAQSAEKPMAPRGIYLGDWNIYAETNDAASDHVIFTVRNEEQAAVLSFGEQYTLEVRNGDRWETLEPEDGSAVWHEMLYTVEPGGKKEETVEFRWLYGSLEPGFYRLVRPCTVEQDGESAEETLYVEFGL